jgi:hypothetical protein
MKIFKCGNCKTPYKLDEKQFNSPEIVVTCLKCGAKNSIKFGPMLVVTTKDGNQARIFLKKGANYKSIADVVADPNAKFGTPVGGTEEKAALEAGDPRERVIVVPDGQSGVKMLQDGRLDVYSLPVLSISDLMTKAMDSIWE